MASIIKPKDFEPSSITFDEVKTNALGGKVVYLNHKDTKKITLQTPILAAPFGMSEYKDDKTGISKLNIDISFKGVKEDPKIQEFMEKMQELDNHIINSGVENSKEWFGAKKKKEIVEELCKVIIKPSPQPDKYEPTMRFKIPTNQKGEILMEAYDQNRNPFDIKNIQKGSKIRAIIECNSVWFVNKQFGISWRAVQIEVQKPDKITGFSFVPDEDEVEEEYEEVEEIAEQAAELALSN